MRKMNSFETPERINFNANVEVGCHVFELEVIWKLNDRMAFLNSASRQYGIIVFEKNNHVISIIVILIISREHGVECNR